MRHGWVHSGPDSEAGAATQISPAPGRGQTGRGLVVVGREWQGSPQQTQVLFHCIYFGFTMWLAGSQFPM